MSLVVKELIKSFVMWTDHTNGCQHVVTCWILAVCAVAAMGMRAIVILTLGTRLQTTNGYTSARLLAIATPQRGASFFNCC